MRPREKDRPHREHHLRIRSRHQGDYSTDVLGQFWRYGHAHHRMLEVRPNVNDQMKIMRSIFQTNQRLLAMVGLVELRQRDGKEIFVVVATLTK